jgi:hypothetical protein
MRRRGIELRRVRIGQSGEIASDVDHHALQTQAQAERGDAVGARIGNRPDLALDAAYPEPTRDHHGVHVGQLVRDATAGLTVVGGHPPGLDMRLVGEPPSPHGLGDRQVRVGQVDVLPDQGDRHRLPGLVHAVEQIRPLGPVDITEGQTETANDVGVQAFGMQNLGDVIDGRLRSPRRTSD